MAPGCLGTLGTRAASGVWPPFSLASWVDLASAAASARAAQRGAPQTASPPVPTAPKPSGGSGPSAAEKDRCGLPTGAGQGRCLSRAARGHVVGVSGELEGVQLEEMLCELEVQFQFKGLLWEGSERNVQL